MNVGLNVFSKPKFHGVIIHIHVTKFIVISGKNGKCTGGKAIVYSPFINIPCLQNEISVVEVCVRNRETHWVKNLSFKIKGLPVQQL